LIQTRSTPLKDGILGGINLTINIWLTKY
jgi:hypothetical protein